MIEMDRLSGWYGLELIIGRWDGRMEIRAPQRVGQFAPLEV